MDFTVGSVVDGVVTGITKFGAFVEIAPGVTGLVHISEVADAYVKEVSDFLQEKDAVKVKVVSIGDNGKIGLSIKQALPPKPKVVASPQPVFTTPRQKDEMPFEDKLAKFMKDSNDRLVDLKRHQDGRKGR